MFPGISSVQENFEKVANKSCCTYSGCIILKWDVCILKISNRNKEAICTLWNHPCTYAISEHANIQLAQATCP